MHKKYLHCEGDLVYIHSCFLKIDGQILTKLQLKPFYNVEISFSYFK